VFGEGGFDPGTHAVDVVIQSHLQGVVVVYVHEGVQAITVQGVYEVVCIGMVVGEVFVADLAAGLEIVKFLIVRFCLLGVGVGALVKILGFHDDIW
jgi:hypothetical protein